jgi:cation:H+ antiporter
MVLDITAIILGFAILVWGSDRFITGAAAIARNFGVSPLLIGLTIVGFGTSAPEVLVSAVASTQGNPGLAIGNALGSNIANIALILGITAMVAPLRVQSNTLKREYPILLAVCLLAVVLMLDNSLGRTDGVILIMALVLVLFGMVRIGIASRSNDPMNVDFDAEIPEDMSTGAAAAWFLLGLALLLLSSRMLVWGAVNIAQAFGVSDLIIGLTIVALGTSLPELAAGITSALKNEHDIAIGNIIGSNIYNLLAVLPMPGLIAPGVFSSEIMSRDMPVMIGLTLVMFIMSYGFRRDGRINRLEGLLLFSAFIGYQGMLFLGVQHIL